MLAMPTIIGCLNHYGYDAESMDVNCEFLNYILSNEFLNKIKACQRELEEELKSLEASIGKEDDKNFSNDDKEKIKLIKYEIIPKMYEFSFIRRRSFPESFFENKNNFSEYSSLNNIYDAIRKITALTYAISANLESISKNNLVDEFNEQVIERIIKIKPDYIGFSLYDGSQFTWAKDCAKKIKKIIDVHISFGGSDINLRRFELIKDKSFFEECGTLIYGDGEIPIIKFCDYISGKISIEDIPGLIYLGKDREIKLNPQTKETLGRLFPANYDGLDLNQYFAPRRILPIETSRGCYYGKCDFCNFKDGAKLKQKSVEELVEEIKYLQKKHDVDVFFFTDSALHPKFAEELADCIIKNNLKIYYLTFVRFEKEFSKDLLQKMYQSGLRICSWGLESGSDRILDLYNKGTNTETNLRILKDAHSVGLFNYVYAIMGFPKETLEDINKTIDFLLTNKEYIDYPSLHAFSLLKNAPIANHPEKFGLTQEDFNFTTIEKIYQPTEISQQDLSYAFSIINRCYAEKTTDLPLDMSCLMLYLIKQEEDKKINC